METSRPKRLFREILGNLRNPITIQLLHETVAMFCATLAPAPSARELVDTKLCQKQEKTISTSVFSSGAAGGGYENPRKGRRTRISTSAPRKRRILRRKSGLRRWWWIFPVRRSKGYDLRRFWAPNKITIRNSNQVFTLREIPPAHCGRNAVR